MRTPYRRNSLALFKGLLASFKAFFKGLLAFFQGLLVASFPSNRSLDSQQARATSKEGHPKGDRGFHTIGIPKPDWYSPFFVFVPKRHPYNSHISTLKGLLKGECLGKNLKRKAPLGPGEWDRLGSARPPWREAADRRDQLNRRCDILMRSKEAILLAAWITGLCQRPLDNGVLRNLLS